MPPIEVNTVSEFIKIEKKWQKRWKKDKVFEADPISKKNKFFLTVPYPYTNGALHIGHGRTYTVGDLIARYKRMRGYNVLFPMASHMTGTPILGMVERIKAGDPKAIEQYTRDLRLYFDTEDEVEAQLAKFTDPWVTAKFFADIISKDFDALGYSIDWRRKFTTGDKIYNAFIRWQYLKFKEKGYIKQGNYPLLFCPNCGNPVGEDDLLEGETAKVKEFVAIKFPFEDGFLVPATLRPETIFGITNMWINPSATYVWANVDGEKWVVAKAAVEKLKLQAKEVEILEEFPGSEIIGKSHKAIHEDRDVPILPAPFVNPQNATGVVYSVPGHAPFDYIALRDLWDDPSGLDKYGITPEDVHAIEIIGMIDIKGYGKYPAKEAVEKRDIKSQSEGQKLEDATQEIYKAEFYEGKMKDNCGEFSGRLIKEVKDDVIAWLKKNNRCDKFYEPDTRPVVCKCGTDVQVGVFAGQWFLDYQSEGWKETAWKALNEMDIVPETFRNLFEATFDWLTQRPCARKRGIGTRLPFDEEWIIESLSDSTIYMAFYTIAHHIKQNKIKEDQLVPEVFDYVFLGKRTPAKIAEQTGIDAKLLKTMRNEFKYWYPNDQRHTAPSHISNHLSFAIFHHVAIFPEKNWIQCISLNEHVNLEGMKMSKSKGNVIPLVEIPKKYGADVYRTYAISAAEPGSLMDFREKDVPAVRNRINNFQEIVTKYSKKTPKVYRKKDKPTLMTRWLLSKVNSLVDQCTTDLDNFRLRDYAIRATSEMARAVNMYLNRPEVPDEERDGTLAYVADIWVRLMAPMTPHISEELWHKLGRDNYVSLTDWPKADKKLIDSAVESSLEVVRNTLADVREITRLLKDKTPSKVYMYVAPQWMFDAMNSIEEANIPTIIGKIMKHLMSNPEFRKHGKEVKSIVDRIAKENGLWVHSESAKDEIQILEDSTSFLETELGLKVIIHSAEEPEYDPQNKARFALPGRPSLLLE
ncbi:MAG: leucine--tRNA ligase [Candidatus Lokiarchaeota archaeon]|nr:leucine--tRNA ligase [Candidatus Lokiarchaeota archaeon]